MASTVQDKALVSRLVTEAFMSPARRSAVNDWWWNEDTSESSPLSAAIEAYEEAVEIFNAELTHDELKKIRVGGTKNCMSDVLTALKSAKLVYDSKKSTALRWLNKLSARIMYYGQILDTLAQHHPEYTSLAWGTMKFVLMAFLNHEELVVQIAKALSKVADVLPRTELHHILYPTKTMKEAVAQLYARILKLMQRAVRWYKKGPMARVLASVIKPYEFSFKDLVEEIDEYARRLDHHANAAAKAEQRELHLKVIEVLQIVTNIQTVQDRVQLGVSDIQYAHILDAVKVEPTPIDRLQQLESISHRRRRKDRSQPPVQDPQLYNSLNRWANGQQSSLLIVQGSVQAILHAQTLAISVVNLLRMESYAVIWAFPTRAEARGQTSTVGVQMLKYIVAQAMQLNPQMTAPATSSQLSVARFKTAQTEAEWLELLHVILGSLRRVFIVVDASYLFSEFGHKSTWAPGFLKLFERLVEMVPQTCVKVLLMGFGVNLNAANSRSLKWNSASLQTVARAGQKRGRGVQRRGRRR